MFQFKTKSVDSVLSAFNQTIADLQEVAQREQANHEDLMSQAMQMKLQADAANVERQRAVTLSERLTALVTA